MPRSKKDLVLAGAPKPSTVAPKAKWIPKSCADVVERFVKFGGELADRPDHLGPLVRELDAAVLNPPRRAVGACGPQMGKSQLVYGAIIFACLVRAGKRHAYVSYAQRRADQAKRDIALLAEDAGLKPHVSADRIEFAGGSTLELIGVGGSLTGFGVDGILAIDDAVKDDQEASSFTQRESLWAWFEAVADTRMHPMASCVAMGTRWHSDDLQGRLIRKLAWPYIRLPSICDNESDPNQAGRKLGESIWEKRRPAQWLALKRRSPRIFSAIWQGLPADETDANFGPATTYTGLEPGPQTVAYGIDLAFGAPQRGKQAPDYQVLFRGIRIGQRLFLTRAIRKQCAPDQFLSEAAKIIAEKPGPVGFFAGNNEEGPTRLAFRALGIEGKLRLFKAQGSDKLARARARAIPAWNQSRILTPDLENFVGAEQMMWSDILDEILHFTGTAADRNDDSADALAGLCEVLGFGGWIEHGDESWHFRLPPGIGGFRESTGDAVREATARERAAYGGQRSYRASREEREWWLGPRD